MPARGVSSLALRLGATGDVDLNSTAEQCVSIAHGTAARPAVQQVLLVDVVQDEAWTDTSAVRWASGYPVYDETASDDSVLRIRVKFAVPAGRPARARARILFEI